MREKRKQTAKNQYAQNHFLLQLQLLNFDVAGSHYRQRRKGIQQQIIAFVCRNNKNRNSNEKRSEDFLERRMQQQGFTGKRCKHRYQEKQSYGQINGKSPILIIIGKIIQFEINRRMRFYKFNDAGVEHDGKNRSDGSHRKKGNKRQNPVPVISGNVKNNGDKYQNDVQNTPKMEQGSHKNPQRRIKYFLSGSF